jgi:hypothetical protein
MQKLRMFSMPVCCPQNVDCKNKKLGIRDWALGGEKSLVISQQPALAGEKVNIHLILPG